MLSVPLLGQTYQNPVVRGDWEMWFPEIQNRPEDEEEMDQEQNGNDLHTQHGTTFVSLCYSFILFNPVPSRPQYTENHFRILGHLPLVFFLL